jgi:hypothetical protein
MSSQGQLHMSRLQKLQGNLMAAKPMSRLSPVRGMVLGLLAGFAGTVAMDLALLAGLPAAETVMWFA